MEPIYTADYFSLPEGKNHEHQEWSHDWAPLPSPWESRTPPELPLAIWQYTTAALNQQDNLESHSMNDFHFPSYQLSSPTSSILPSPSNTMFSHHTASLASPHVRQSSHFSRNEKKRSRTTESAEDDEDDSGGDSWDQTTPQPSTSRKSLKRSSSQRETSTNDEVSIRNAKRTHTVVEKNYRERLNDKIADLAVYLFETSSDARAKPSKSLVMTRAKERLKQLETRNKTLENEVVKLRQQIAILDHIVKEKKGKENVAEG